MDVEIGDYFHYTDIIMKDEKMKPPEKSGYIKPPYMTSLSGSRMVSKAHGRIAFRGLIDTLEAEVIEAQVLAAGLGEGDFRLCLGEVLEYLRALMAAEVKETPLAPPFLFGMDAEELHRQSHNTEAGGGKVQQPDYTQGALAARLNLLRAKIREAELYAVRVFGPGESPGAAKADAYKTDEREDIILAMNRLSSALWLLFCRCTNSKTRR